MDSSTQQPAGRAPALRGQVAAIAGLCVLPFLLLLAFIERRAVGVPYSDEWDLIPLLHKQAMGTLRLSDLWAQHNEHRDFFPQLVLVRLARVTHWNLRWELAINLVLAVATLAIVVCLLRAVLRPLGPVPVAIGTVAAAWLTLSPVQWENWLSGWQVQWFLCQFAVVAALALLFLWPTTRPTWIPVMGAIVLAAVGSYSLASGLFVWPAALYILWVQPRYRRWIAVWVAAGAAVGLFFLKGWHHPAGSPPLTSFLHHPLDFVLYILAYLGAGLAGRQALAIVTGVGVGGLFLLTVGYLLKYNRAAFRDSAAWVALTMFTLLSELETAVGRVGYGVAQATASRYTTADILFIIATMVFCFQAYNDWSQRVHPGATEPAFRWARIALLVILVSAIVASYSAGIDGSRVYHAREVRGQVCMTTATQASHACLNVLAANGADFVYTQLVYLRASRLLGQHQIPGG